MLRKETAIRVRDRTETGAALFDVPVEFNLNPQLRDEFLEAMKTSCRKRGEPIPDFNPKRPDLMFHCMGGGHQFALNVDRVLEQHGPEFAKRWPALLEQMRKDARQAENDRQAATADYKKRTGKDLYDITKAKEAGHPGAYERK